MKLAVCPPKVAALLAVSLTLMAGCGSGGGSSSTTRSTVQTTTQSGTSSGSSTLGYEGIPLEQGPDLAPASSTTQGQTVDGIQCGATEQLTYHIHAHLAVYVNGSSQAIPAGIGIPGAAVQQTQFGPVVGQGQCFYWLHTHTPDGVLHIESPTSRVYTLGNFFDEWRQPLSPHRVGPQRGKVTAFVNRKPWTKDPRLIPLVPHAAIQLDVGSPVAPFQAVSFDKTQL